MFFGYTVIRDREEISTLLKTDNSLLVTTDKYEKTSLPHH